MINLSRLALSALILAGCAGHGMRDVAGYLPAEGDIVFRRGRGAKSEAVRWADAQGAYSHTGIVAATDTGFVVVHITPGERESGRTRDVIKAEKLGVFFAPDRAGRGEARRFADPAETGARAAARALELFAAGIEFDHDYALDDSVRLYCTELVWRAYRAAGCDITRGSRTRVRGFGTLRADEMILPSDIYANRSLFTVYKF